TRWQREAQTNLEVLRGRVKLLEKSLRNVPRTNIETLDIRSSRIQGALSVGDRRIGEVIRLAAAYGGLGGWRRAEKETGIPFFEIAGNPNRYSESLPWDFIL
ncbi:MAG: hypothetical protein ACFFDV_12790, partial [Candidatus Thorarchaeota archaeon]